MKLKNLHKLLLNLFFLIASFSTNAQQRVVEESLVYDDPTVAKSGKWLFGLGVDYYNYSTQNQYENSGTTYYSNVKFSQPGASAWVGYGDLTLLVSYKQGSGSTTFTDGSGFTSDQKDLDINLRYLLMPISAKYFVPYVLASYTRINVKDTINNNSQVTTTTKFNAPGIGIGGIIPLTEKYGLRADYKRYKGTSSSVSSDPSDVFVPFTQITKITATAYYNITQNINFQVGARTEYIQNVPQSTTTGGYLSLGYTF